MLARLLALLLLATALAASAQPSVPAPLLVIAEPADWKALLCVALVLGYIARRRWRAD